MKLWFTDKQWESGAKLVADIMSSLLQMFASSSKQTAADYFSKQLHTENRRQGLGFCRSVAMTIYLTTSAETSASPPTYQILIWERWNKKVHSVVCHQFLMLAVCDQSFHVEIIQGSKFKSLKV